MLKIFNFDIDKTVVDVFFVLRRFPFRNEVKKRKSLLGCTQVFQNFDANAGVSNVAGNEIIQ